MPGHIVGLAGLKDQVSTELLVECPEEAIHEVKAWSLSLDNLCAVKVHMIELALFDDIR